MFFHRHPYPPFLPKGVRRLIVGTLPPPRFSVGELRHRDVDFCYGSADNLLWPILAEVYGCDFDYNNSHAAVRQRKEFLAAEKIGICDLVDSCQRHQINAADLGMTKIRMRALLAVLKEQPQLKTMLFVGGNSKNGPEYLFRKQLKSEKLQLEVFADELLRCHRFEYKGRSVITYSLISPSKAANRAIGGNVLYKERKAINPAYTPFDFRVEQYRSIFLEKRLA